MRFRTKLNSRHPWIEMRQGKKGLLKGDWSGAPRGPGMLPFPELNFVPSPEPVPNHCYQWVNNLKIHVLLDSKKDRILGPVPAVHLYGLTVNRLTQYIFCISNLMNLELGSCELPDG